MFLKNIGLIVINHRVDFKKRLDDCKQTYGRLITHSYRLSSIDRMLIYYYLLTISRPAAFLWII